MKIIARTYLIIVLIMTTIGLLSAQAPPRELEGRFHDEHNNIELRWHEPEGDNHPQFYNVYKKTGDELSYQLLSSPSDDQYDDNQITLSVTYQYYVTAIYSGNIESTPSNIVEVLAAPDSLEDSTRVALHFTSTPVSVAFLNQPYVYDADVESNPVNPDICFSLEEAPSGMTINSSTGVVEWTPTSLGIFEVEIKARTCSGGEGEAEQEFHVMVVSGNPGSLIGLVQDDLGRALGNIKIKFFDVSTGIFVMRTFTDSTGHYAFPIVNPGTYFVKADPENELFEDQWFDNAEHIEQATPVVINEGETVTVNFTLHIEDDIEEHFQLAGTVMDLVNNPIAGARVSAFRTDDEDDDDPLDDLFDDNHDDHHRRHRDDRSAITDSSGNYTLTLRGGSYIVSAVKQGFLGQFWDHQPSPLEANIIDLHHDTSNIDFNLALSPVGSGSISGFILSAMDSSGLESHVTGFQQDSAGNFTGFVSFDESDSNGVYRLNHLPPGAYIILAHDGHDFVPTFYSTTGGTPLLGNATPVAVNNNSVVGINIFVQPDSSEGLNSISGEVSNESDGTSSSPESITPLSGAIVTLLNNEAKPIGSAISGSDGAYIAPGISPGTYSVVFQKPGKSSVTATANVSYANNLPTLTILNAELGSSLGSEVVSILNLQKSWNLISLPLTLSDYHKSTIFPSSTSSAFTYDGTYYTSDVLTNGVGYWLKFPSSASTSIAIVGAQRLNDTVAVVPGWNLIGSISSPISTNSIVSVPPSMSTSQFFGYQGTYVQSTIIEPGRGYWVKVNDVGKLVLSANSQVLDGTINIIVIDELPPSAPDDRKQGNVIPNSYALAQNYPNPFNPRTMVQFDLPVTSKVSVRIFDILGKMVRVLFDGISYEKGSYEVSFDASGLSSGVYYYRLEATSTTSSFIQVKKMTLLK